MKKIHYMFLLAVLILSLTGCKKEAEKPKPSATPKVEKTIVYEEATDKELEVHAVDGDVKAQMELANRYDYGTAETGRNFTQAQIWYEMAAAQNDKDALRCLGYLHLNGCLGKADYERAVDYFEQAIALGDVDAHVGLARAYMEGYPEDSTNTIMENVQIAYQKGRPAGIYYMAYLLENGITTSNDFDEAKKLYEQVLELTDLSIYDRYLVDAARTRLGVMYMNASGVEQSYETALDYFKSSAENGYAMAQYYVGLMYEMGYGVDQDYDDALEWYMMAVEQEYAPALNQVGYMYYKGYGVDVDINQAIYYQKLAAMQGYAAAQINLGYLYENGVGVEKNLEAALAYYQMAAEQNSEGAKEAVARVEKHLNEKK